MEKRKRRGGFFSLAAAAVGLTLMLTACAGGTTSEAPRQETAAEPDTSHSESREDTETAQTVPSDDGKARLTMDLSNLEMAMPPENYQALTGYFPVLQEGLTFHWTSGPFRSDGWAEQEVTLAAFRDRLWDEVSGEPETMALDSLTVLDLDGDGVLELILQFQDIGGHDLILHRKGNDFYGTDLPIRWFEGLQQNGVYIASGGAATNWYYTLSFQDGRFLQQELGHMAEITDSDGAYAVEYVIAGEPVTQEVFQAWEAEIMPADAVWYVPEQ